VALAGGAKRPKPIRLAAVRQAMVTRTSLTGNNQRFTLSRKRAIRRSGERTREQRETA
jgi:hypothetical protein